MKLNEVLNSDAQRKFFADSLDEAVTLQSDGDGRTYKIRDDLFFFSSDAGSDAWSETGEDGDWKSFP